MIPIVTPEEMASIDAAAPEPVEVLVHRAGGAVARAAVDLLGGASGRRVVVLAGPGNNGADGLDAAARLRRMGAHVDVVRVGEVGDRLPAADLCIDAAFGTGLSRPWSPPAPSARVLAVDIPSGVAGLTGERLGDPWQAERTVTFAALKPGLLLGAGATRSGRIDVVDIGLDVGRARAHLVEASDVARWVPERPADSHKWRAGVRVLAGSPGMSGAGHLVAAAAMRGGAGIVHASAPGTTGSWPVEVVERSLPESGWADDALDGLGRFRVLAAGPGLGRLPTVASDLHRLLATSDLPVVLDADAIGAVDAAALAARSAPTVLTPHAGEFERLAGAPPAADRFEAVRRVAAEVGCVVLLKGPTTLVAEPGGQVLAVAEGDARLATAGSGDVLTGLLAAYLARGIEAHTAAAAAAFVHGRAARLLPREGVVAGDLVGVLGEALESCR